MIIGVQRRAPSTARMNPRPGDQDENSGEHEQDEPVAGPLEAAEILWQEADEPFGPRLHRPDGEDDRRDGEGRPERIVDDRRAAPDLRQLGIPAERMRHAARPRVGNVVGGCQV
jgi:hypothetical protein